MRGKPRVGRRGELRGKGIILHEVYKGRLGGGFWGVLSFLKSWTSPLAQQKKSMTLHKKTHENVWPFPSPLKATWYYWSVLAGCLLIATHVTTLRQNTEFHLVYVIKLSWNVVLVTLWENIIVKERTTVNFIFWKKMLWCWQMFKVPLMSINEHFYRNLYTFLRTLAKKIIKLIETSSFYDHSNSNKSAQSSARRLATVRLLRFGRTGREWVSDVIPGTSSHSDSENC